MRPVFREGAPKGMGAIGWTAFVMLLALLILQGMVCGLMAMLLYRGRHRLARSVDGASRAGGGCPRGCCPGSALHGHLETLSIAPRGSACLNAHGRPGEMTHINAANPLPAEAGDR